MSRIDVLVAATTPDVKAEGIAAAVAARSDMTLVRDGVVSLAEVEAELAALPPATPAALVLVGPHADTDLAAARWLADRTGLVILRVDVIDDVVHIALRDATLDSLLAALRTLIDHAGPAPRERVARFQLKSVAAAVPERSLPNAAAGAERPLLHVAMEWIHTVLREVAAAQPGGQADVPGLTLTAGTVTALLDDRPAHVAPAIPANVAAADAALTRALAEADASSEPLAVLVRVLRLTALEVRLVLLALAPELDPRYQRCLGFLHDDLGRRVGTLGLASALVGEPLHTRLDLAHAGNLARWRVFEGRSGGLPAADEPLRLDHALAGWLLGELSALDHDPQVRRALRLAAWPGASILSRPLDHTRAASFVGKVQGTGEAQWLLFTGTGAAGWRALLELGADLRRTLPLRVDVTRVAALDVAEIEETGLRLGRLCRLSGRPLFVDATVIGSPEHDDDALRLFFAAIGGTGCRSGVIATETSRIVRLLGTASYALIDASAMNGPTRAAAVRAAAKGADVVIDEGQAQALARRYPLEADGFEQAMRLARSRRLPADDEPRRRARFDAACKEIAAEGISQLAERIAPMFDLTEVVLPADRSSQLDEIVDSVRYASKVLDGWKFRDQLPYGRGVTALFHGASGTGKTMAALAIARRLDVDVLRVDLSRVVSKYIGDTEKNIDRVFADAQRSGAALLIDEADALFGKRSEVKDAHDRYANIEVAYLLQRMESYEGLAILTTNLRQNLDPAFLRRLRFIVEFPRPDAEARDRIWRQCLPEGSHTLDDAAFRQLARKIDLTGGHIRQITLRAAFAAAAADTTIALPHIAHAARAEFAKLGLPAVELDQDLRREAA